MKKVMFTVFLLGMSFYGRAFSVYSMAHDTKVTKLYENEESIVSKLEYNIPCWAEEVKIISHKNILPSDPSAKVGFDIAIGVLMAGEPAVLCAGTTEMSKILDVIKTEEIFFGYKVIENY